jgi:hypothetical protein
VHWQSTLAETIQATNGVLSELGVRLALERASLWRPKTSSGTLETTIDELRSFDAGADVDFVVGLVGSLPRVEFSFHQLGMAGLLGTHMVVRAMNDAAEFRAIQQYLDELDEGERHKLYQSRKRHKNASVLLHELGHALGALHVQNPEELMHPTYSPEASSFGPETLALLTIALSRPNYATDREQQQVVIEESLQQLKTRQSAAWVVGERESRIEMLEKMRARKAPRSDAPTRASASATISQPGPDVAPDARALFERAAAALAAQREREAWSAAEPLFAKYPKDYAVQELRCKIATALSLPWDEIRAHCLSMMSLTPGVPESFR